MAKDERPPILLNKHHRDASVFHPENLLREARRQKGIPIGEVPDVCLLDPDGDIVRWLFANDKAKRSPHWACYHTNLFTFDSEGRRVGVIGNAVGASFAVLLAEQLFASGCKLLVSITSAGSIATDIEPPCFVLIDKALRDEGTSYHYLPPAEFAHALRNRSGYFLIVLKSELGLNSRHALNIGGRIDGDQGKNEETHG